jgi:shikimate kinase
LLDTNDRLGKIRSILEERDPLYNEIADLKVNVDNLQAKQIIIEISEFIENYE